MMIMVATMMTTLKDHDNDHGNHIDHDEHHDDHGNQDDYQDNDYQDRTMTLLTMMNTRSIPTKRIGTFLGLQLNVHLEENSRSFRIQ